MPITNNLPTTRIVEKFRQLSRSDFLILVTTIALSNTVVHAQSFEGQSFRLGETALTPELRVDYVSVDNAFRSSNDEEEATGVIVSPALNWEADRRLLALRASYRGSYGAYSESQLDFTDHDLRFDVNAAPAIRHRTSLKFRFLQQTEEFGTGQSSFTGGLDDQIVDTTTSLSAGYTFGVRDAKGNVGGGLSLLSRGYNDLGAVTDGDDYTSIGPFVFFSYKLSPDARFRLEARFLELDYDADSRDRSSVSLLAGVDLDATERTGGTVRLGISEADFDSADVPSRNTFVADINLYYKPRTYSRFDLTFNRDFETIDDNPSGVGESVVDDIRFRWRFAWSSRFSTSVILEADRFDRECPGVDTVTNEASLDFDVAVRRWLSIGAGVGTSRQTASFCNPADNDGSRDYDRNSFGVHFIATL